MLNHKWIYAINIQRFQWNLKTCVFKTKVTIGNFTWGKVVLSLMIAIFKLFQKL